jgi:SAM-dependent methyltransferase
MNLPELVRTTILHAGFRRATFGGTPRSKIPCPWVRVLVRPLLLRGESHWQFSYYDERKHIAKNFPAGELDGKIAQLLVYQFAGIHLETTEESIDIRTTKKGQVNVGRKKVANAGAAEESHNRVKDVPLPEGKADPLLETMGILAADGKVKAGMRAKYTQVNEFLKQLKHALADAELLNLGRELVILDCGCGSSYLTLAAHHYLNDVLNVPAKLLGIDVNEEVIRKSTAKAHTLGAGDVVFQLGRIGSVDVQPDVVLALHACDTATDDALIQAVKSGAKLILSVPCCHRHLNKQIESAVLKPMLRHGILRERTADILTDSFRALLLRIAGYRTDVFEFISSEATARNLMIRAVHGAPVNDPAFVKEYEELKSFWGVTPYLDGRLEFQQNCESRSG